LKINRVIYGKILVLKITISTDGLCGLVVSNYAHYAWTGRHLAILSENAHGYGFSMTQNAHMNHRIGDN